MFSSETDASKVALAGLMQQLAGRGFGLLDCQLETPHLNSLGSRLMARRDFIRVVSDLGGIPDPAGGWQTGPRPTRELF
mgnify:FL=1